MFGLGKKKVIINTDVKENEEKIKSLKNNIQTLKEELSDVKLQKKMEQEDVKHMVKINEERKEIEIEKEKIRLTGTKDKEIAEIKDKYRDKLEGQLQNQLVDIKTMYSEVLQRLPNYNVKHTTINKT